MSWTDTLKEIKDQMVEEEKKDQVEEVEEADEPEEKVEEEKTEEEPVKEDPEPEEKKEEEPDSVGYARLRREAAAAKKKADALEVENAKLKAAPVEEEIETKAELPDEVAEVVQDLRRRKAEQEFIELEGKFKSSTPDYDGVSREYTMALAQSIRIQNPRYSPDRVAEETKKTILVKAANYLNGGFDPIEELYHEAKELGFTGKSFQKEEPEKEVKEIKPDLKKVAVNRQKSTGMTGANGRSQPQLTPLAAADMNVAEFSKLSKAEKQAVYAQLAQA